MSSRDQPCLDPSKGSLFNLFYQYSDRTNCIGNYNFPTVQVSYKKQQPTVRDLNSYSQFMYNLTGIQSRVIEVIIIKELEKISPYLPWFLKLGDYSRSEISLPFEPKAFCPRCYWEQKERGEKTYPLLEHNLPWSVICTTHMYPLSDISLMPKMEDRQLYNSVKYAIHPTCLIGALPMTFKTAFKFSQIYESPDISLMDSEIDFLEVFYAICFILGHPITRYSETVGNCIFELGRDSRVFGSRDFFNAATYLDIGLDVKAKMLNLIGHFLYEAPSFEPPPLTQQKKRVRSEFINTYNKDLREIETNNLIFLVLITKHYLSSHLEEELERHFPNFYALVWKRIIQDIDGVTFGKYSQR